MSVPFIECSEGWAGLYGPLIERCKAEGVHITQIKEKFGGLRFYVRGGSPELHAAIDAAEAQSFSVCEECGAPGKRAMAGRSGGWIKTLCDAHAPAKP